MPGYRKHQASKTWCCNLSSFIANQDLQSCQGFHLNKNSAGCCTSRFAGTWAFARLDFLFNLLLKGSIFFLFNKVFKRFIFTSFPFSGSVVLPGHKKTRSLWPGAVVHKHFCLDTPRSSVFLIHCDNKSRQAFSCIGTPLACTWPWPGMRQLHACM